MPSTVPSFTRYWFRRNKSIFMGHIHPQFVGKPIKYLEIGVWEAGSLHWMMSNVMTHPDSRCIAIDPYAAMGRRHPQSQMDEIYNRARTNCLPWIENKQLDLIRGESKTILPGLAGRKFDGTFDFCYIDGDHKADAVFADATHCFRLTKSGGWILFDDVNPFRPKVGEVKDGLDMFLKSVEGQIKEIWRGKFANCYEKV